MNYYKPQTIKSGITISRYLGDRGIKTQGNRAVAAWRDGSRYSVSFDDAQGLWHDFVAEDGGDIIALFIKCEGGDFLTACRTLGDRYNLTPDKVSRKPKAVTHGEILARNGFTLVKTYVYTDEVGTPIHYVERYERTNEDGKREKEFSQGRYEGERHVDGLGGVKTVLYNLPHIIKAEGDVYLVEGEKDADTLNGLGLVATTNAGGCEHWTDDLAARLKGKRVVIIADNDKKGQDGAQIRAASVARVAASVKVITISALPKGDVTDWLEQEGGTVEKLRKAVADAHVFEAPPEDKKETLQIFTNVEMIATMNENGKMVQRPKPKKLNEISGEVFRDYNGWPRNIGGVLFDFHPNKKPGKQIEKLPTHADLFAWIARRGDRNIDWLKSRGCHTKEELFAQLKSEARRYEMISFAPHYPMREDVFYSVPTLPAADPSHAAFEKLVDFFNPCDAAHRTLMKAFFLTPLWFNPGRDEQFVKPQPRPGFVIDTVDAQASGKSTVVNMCAQLYGTSCIRKSKATLTDETAVKKSILSEEGRRKRIFLLDNVTGTLKNDFLADLMTAPEITGLAPYGHGDESRPNDLTFAVTVNGAELDTDLATRFYIIKIHAPDPALLAQSATSEMTIWESKIDKFIADNRLQLFADMIDLLSHAPFRSRGGSRFPMFDATVLSAASNSNDEFNTAAQAIAEEATSANVDKANAETFETLVEWELAALPQHPTVLTNAAVMAIMEKEPTFSKWSINTLRTRLLKPGLLPHFSRTFERFPPNNPDGRERGMFYGMHLQDEGRMTQYQVLDWHNGQFKITRKGCCGRKEE